MAEWHVSESETEENGHEETGFDMSVDTKSSHLISLDLQDAFGFKINPATMVQLLQAVKKRQTLDLDCVSDYKRDKGAHRKRKRKNKDRGMESMDVEETSETASEMRSTYTTSTAECRDNRRPSLSAFDYEHEDFPALVGMNTAKKNTLPAKRGKEKVARLDVIEARIERETEEQIRWTQQLERDHENVHMWKNDSNTSTHLQRMEPSSHTNSVSSIYSFEIQPLTSDSIERREDIEGRKSIDDENRDCTDEIMTNGHNTEIKTLNFSFDEDESDHDIPSEFDFFSKIRCVEQFLEQDDV